MGVVSVVRTGEPSASVWEDNGAMVFLFRVELPDVPGALGALATTLGATGADIDAIEIVERNDGRVVDDVLLEVPAGVLPDALVSACQRLEQVRVLWVSRYNAGASLGRDLETVEAMTGEPRRAVAWLVDLAPATFRADWAMALRESDGVPVVVRATATAPKPVPEMKGWFALEKAKELPSMSGSDSTVLAGAPLPGLAMVVVFGRHGGPAVLGSELARLGHLAALAESVSSGR